MPKAYWIPHLDVSNPEGFQAYRDMADAAHQRFGSKLLARGGRREAVEGRMRARNGMSSRVIPCGNPLPFQFSRAIAVSSAAPANPSMRISSAKVPSARAAVCQSGPPVADGVGRQKTLPISP